MEAIVMLSPILVVLLGVLLLFRNQLVYRARMKRLDAIKHRAYQLISERLDRSWELLYADFHAGPSYLAMVFDLRKWAYRDFYSEDV